MTAPRNDHSQLKSTLAQTEPSTHDTTAITHWWAKKNSPGPPDAILSASCLKCSTGFCSFVARIRTLRRSKKSEVDRQARPDQRSSLAGGPAHCACSRWRLLQAV